MLVNFYNLLLIKYIVLSKDIHQIKVGCISFSICNSKKVGFDQRRRDKLESDNTSNACIEH